MSFLVVLIVDNPDDCPEVLESWEKLGVTGVTILESTGLGRLKRAGLLEDLPIIPSLSVLVESREELHRTLLSVVDSEEKVNLMVTAAQEIIGDRRDPHSGFLFVLPVLHVYSLGRDHVHKE